MNHKALLSAVVSMGLIAGGPAFGQGYDHRDDHGHSMRDMHMQHGNPHSDRGHDDRHDSHADNRGHDARGAGPHHDFRRGGRLPYEYRNRQYVVNHWRDHHLHVPPRGYQWVQTGADYVLVAIATGIIAQIVLGN